MASPEAMSPSEKATILETGLVALRRQARILGYSGIALLAGGMGLGVSISTSEIQSAGHVDPHLLPFYIIGGMVTWAATGAGGALMGGAIATVRKINSLFQTIGSPNVRT